MICPSCHKDVAADAAFCPQCGQRLAGISTPEEHATAAENFRQNVHAGHVPTDDIETDLWSGTYSPKAMYGAWLVAGAITVVGLAVGIFAPANKYAWLAILAVILLMWLGLGARLLHRRMSIRYRLTNVRFFYETGVLRRITDRIEVIHIDDVTVSQGFVQRIFGVGNILLTTTDRIAQQVTIVGIDNVIHVADMIDTVRRELRNRRGLRVEQIQGGILMGAIMAESSERELNREWAARWRRFGPELQRIQYEELRNFRYEDHLAEIDALCELGAQFGTPPLTSGLVEQQRLFQKFRK